MSNTRSPGHSVELAGLTPKNRRGAVQIASVVLSAIAFAALADHGDGNHAVPSTPQEKSILPTAPESQSVVETFRGLAGVDENPFGEFLDPDIAFAPTLEASGEGVVRARWEIADDYYLYRDKFRFQIVEPEDAEMGEPRLAPGKVKEDEFFGRVEVYYQFAEATIPVRSGAGSGGAVAIELGYQGCADAGLCYPPMTKILTVSLAADSQNGGSVTDRLGALTTPTRSVTAPGLREVAEQDRIARTLASGTSWITIATFFGFGLLLAFTPCVLPMVPIISGIIAGQGPAVTTRRAFFLSLTFVLSMAAAYTAAGVAAGLTGANLQAVFQAPWILISFSVLFIVLALAMFGLFELQIPTAWQTRLTACFSCWGVRAGATTFSVPYEVSVSERVRRHGCRRWNSSTSKESTGWRRS